MIEQASWGGRSCLFLIKTKLCVMFGIYHIHVLCSSLILVLASLLVWLSFYRPCVFLVFFDIFFLGSQGFSLGLLFWWCSLIIILYLQKDPEKKKKKTLLRYSWNIKRTMLEHKPFAALTWLRIYARSSESSNSCWAFASAVQKKTCRKRNHNKFIIHYLEQK